MRGKIPYGYRIQDGALTVLPQEAIGVKKIFSLYLAGSTQEEIAKTLNAEGFTYSKESPAWSRLRIRQALQNPRYAGAKEHPAIISRETFQEAQSAMAGRARQRGEHPALCLVKKIRCGRCGNDLRRVSECQWRDTLHFLCDHCRAKATITDADLLAEIERQAAEYTPPPETPYRPSAEVVRLTNAINRGLEHPERTDVVGLIMQGIAARYDCFTTQVTATELQDMIRKGAYDQAIQCIAIAPDNTVTVTFKGQK